MIFLSDFYCSVFGCKAYKVAVDAGCTCPNRDGTKGFGGCIFCSESGSGDFIFGRQSSVSAQVEKGKLLIEKKSRGRSGKNPVKFIAYFQNFTSTYGDERVLESKYTEALSCRDVAGLAVATRPDCLSDKMLDILASLSDSCFVQIELGLQTSNEKTGKLINRLYTDDDYLDCIKRIRAKASKIHVVTHLIFGLPKESEEDMLDSVRFVLSANKESELFGLKMTSLYVVQNTVLSKMHERGEYECLTKEKYFSILLQSLKLLPDNCVVHRLTGDPPKSILIAPTWTADKKIVMNEIKQMIKQQFGDKY